MLSSSDLHEVAAGDGDFMQLQRYMKQLGILLGLLINLNVERLTEGVSHLILPGANSPD